MSDRRTLKQEEARAIKQARMRGCTCTPRIRYIYAGKSHSEIGVAHHSSCLIVRINKAAGREWSATPMLENDDV